MQPPRGGGAALGISEPLYRGEIALEPERVSEKLHQIYPPRLEYGRRSGSRPSTRFGDCRYGPGGILSGSPYVDEIAAGGWRLDTEGLLPIPDTPGLGLTMDDDAVARYTEGELGL